MTTAHTQPPRPVVLCILDGWGWRGPAADNAITLADTPNWDRLTAEQPMAFLNTSAEAVGLPAGQMGNSEVGHLNIGAGRVVMQELPKIDTALADGSLAANPEMTRFIDGLKASGGTAHILGLISDGGVHSHQDHIAGMARIIAGAGVPVRIHALLDGRDTPPKSAPGFISRLQDAVAGGGDIAIATIGGRYWGMDRDKRWKRVVRAYDVIVKGEGNRFATAAEAIAAAHAADVTDEFVDPAAIGGYAGVRDGDGLLMANFRADRAREILHALIDPAFDGFERGAPPRFAAVLGMVEYSSVLAPMIPALFPPTKLANILGEVVSKAGRRQLRMAETEKYAHVTFFMNGGEEQMYPGEERILVPSPKVATYDLQPEMSAPELTDKLVAAIRSGGFDLIIVNYANGDMVGHSGILSAAIKAAEAVDACLGRVVEALDAVGGCMLITADHGNAEQMFDPLTNGPHTAHTTNVVPLVLAGGGAPANVALSDGRLADLAPTVLTLMGLERPAEMTGQVLIKAAPAARRAAGA
ncbi:2,3-bisphosphoglycerate-independent phosphoglycerate mutase [Tistrella bauzanensis]|uniref:2,3-bisphosphoglycerate-independent phosphoglycerate mutase n=1 Tax=Tistrella bauzanensis TaxID=657419 RepID=A0ABQ1IBQ1_9PROT|nr:2,3-bisphosphoglycerate-independent phosphoglycerate mutase [Tistrella bauzanensis]GGB31798.1 2,3-bisphosphoglycerate-independent phosphoglycerate mutase [Tistrella bauzanensis]